MLINVRYKKDKWVVDEKEAMLFIEFRRVLQDESLGAKAMAYIALSYDPESKFQFSSKDENEVRQDVYQTVYECDVTENPENNELVAAAVQRYKSLCGAGEKIMQPVETENIKGGQPLSWAEKRRS